MSSFPLFFYLRQVPLHLPPECSFTLRLFLIFRNERLIFHNDIYRGIFICHRWLATSKPAVFPIQEAILERSRANSETPYIHNNLPRWYFTDFCLNAKSVSRYLSEAGYASCPFGLRRVISIRDLTPFLRFCGRTHEPFTAQSETSSNTISTFGLWLRVLVD